MNYQDYLFLTKNIMKQSAETEAEKFCLLFCNFTCFLRFLYTYMTSKKSEFYKACRIILRTKTLDNHHVQY